MENQIAATGNPDEKLTRKPQWLALAILLFVALGVRLALAPSMLNYDDRRDYVSAGHKAMRYGIGHYYDHAKKSEREYKGLSGVPLPYPPLQIYAYTVAAYLYQHIVDASFAAVSDWREMPVNVVSLNYLIKAPLFFCELLLTAVIFFWVRKQRNEKTALLCAAAYAFNPAVIYDGAMWAQPDALHCLFIVLSVICLLLRKPVWCLVFLALALLSKPQPTVFVPMIILLVFLSSTWKELFAAIGASIGVALLILLPFLLVGVSAIRDMLDVMSNVNTYASVNGHNLWWLVASLKGLNPAKTLDNEKVVAALSYFTLSMILLGITYVLVLLKIIERRQLQRLKSLWTFSRQPLTDVAKREAAGFDWQLLSEAFAYLGFAFFIFAVRMHENHAIQVLPLLLLTCLRERRLQLIFALLSLTMLFNMMLHSVEITGEEVTNRISNLRLANSLVNLLIFAYWSSSFFWQRRMPAICVKRRIVKTA